MSVSGKPPRSSLAVAFYVAGLVLLASNVRPAIGVLGNLSSRAPVGDPAVSGMVWPMVVSLIVYPALIVLFGGVVQILADIRWALLQRRVAPGIE